MLLRSVRSAVIAAILVGLHIGLLTLFLNPGLVPRNEAAALVQSIVLPYAVVCFVAFVIAAAVLNLVRGVGPLPRPLLEGFPWVSTLSFIALSGVTGLYGLNLAYHRLSLPVEFVRGMLTSGVAIAIAALAVFTVIVDSWLFSGRARGGAAAVVVLSIAGSLVAPLLCLPVGRAPQVRRAWSGPDSVAPRRIFFVGLDAVGPEMLDRAIAHGRGAVLARLRREGAFMPLATLRPTEGPPVWSSLWTGRLPRDHGVKSAYGYSLRGSPSSYELLPKGIFASRLERAGLATLSPVGSNTLQTPALWHVLSGQKIQAGIVRLWGTHPAEPISGFVVSDRFFESRGVAASQSVYPPLLLETAQPAAVRPDEVDAALLSRFVGDSSDPGGATAWRQDLIDGALVQDLTYERVGEALRSALDPAFYALYFRGPDRVGHAFFRFAQPESFGNVSPANVRRFGGVIDGYIDLVSETVGRLVDASRPGDVVVVVSAYGLSPMPTWRRMVQNILGGPIDSATHEWGPPGFMLVWGQPIAPGSTAHGASVLDVAPTLLYLMGSPLARDLDGGVLVDILADDFARTHPITFVPSYAGAGRH